MADSKGTDAASRTVKRSWRGVGVLGLLLLSLALLGVIYAAGLSYLRPSAPGQELSYDKLFNDASNHKVKSAQFLDEDARIVGTVDDGGNQDFWTAYPRSDATTNDLVKQLVTGGATVTVEAQSSKALVRFIAQFLLPLVILANLFALLFYLSRGSGGGVSEFLGFARAGDKRMGSEEKARATFSDIAAADESVVELAEVRDYLASPKAFEAMGALPPKGVLLMGPPGCGKTLLARAVAGEARANFYTMSGSEFVESLVGVGAARVRDLFRQARASSPSIIFIDELDAVGRQRGAGLGGGHDEREQTLNEMLVQMDGFSPSEGVVLIGATNRPDILDPALLRAGRFDRHITVERPDLSGRLAILMLHARGRRLKDPEHDLPLIARHTAGFTGADLANVLNEAALLAVRSRKPVIELAELDEAVDRVMAGPKRKGMLISDEEKRRIAYHEAGHAVVGAAMGKGGAVDRVSVIARGRGIGHMAVVAEDKTLLTREDMEAQIAIAMAGIAAEELVFGQPSTGSEQDLERATNTARDMAGRYGMSPRLGRARVLREQREVFLGRDYLATKDVSQPTLEHLDAEVRRVLDENEVVATAVLTAHRDVLDQLAATLMAQETVIGAALSQVLAGVRPYLRVEEAAAGMGTPSVPLPPPPGGWYPSG